MRKVIIAVLLLSVLAAPVSAAEYSAPTVPDSGESMMPEDAQTFGGGLWELLCKALPMIQPSFTEGLRTCLGITAVVLLVSMIKNFGGATGTAADLAGAAAIGILLLGASNSLILMAADTVRELSDYGKLLLPVMTSALASGGGTTASASLYLGTAVFDAALSSLISRLLIPMVYIFLALAISAGALGGEGIKQLRDFLKWLITWSLKTILYVFTGYMSITGVVSGSADAAALKAAKLTISGMVPVVGGILSDTSEAVLVGADLVRNAAGVYGLLAILSVWIGPFLKIGIQYLLLKLTADISAVFVSDRAVGLIRDFTAAMGLLLAMTGTVCLMLLISTVCFMKGVG